jgi:hypothetical protein
MPNAQVCYSNNVWFILSFLLFFYEFSVFIIIWYNKIKVFLFHFCNFVYLDASLKFGEKKTHLIFFQVRFSSKL